MNIYMQCCALILLIVILGEMTEVAEGYRPYKRYHRKPLRRPRWHPYPRSSKYHRSKRRYPPKEYRRPERYRHYPEDEDIDHPQENRPYTIVIQLPKKDDKYSPETYHRAYEVEESLPLYVRDEDDYIEDEDDGDERMFRVDKKRVRVKVRKGENPQLQIKISRMDAADDIRIVDKSDLTTPSMVPQSSSNFTLTMEPDEEEGDWSSTENPTTITYQDESG